MNNDFYVYVYYRLDTNEPFYVGKGRGDRWKRLNRENKHFNSIVKSIPIAVEIVKNNLTEEQSFYWEEEIIRRLVFEYGYSIDIKGANSNDHYSHLVNQTWGGEGVSGLIHSEETKQKMSESHKGEKNYWYGKHLSEETKTKLSDAQKGKYDGENNPMYGKHHTKETRDKISKTRIEKEIGKGENNNFYGVHRLGIESPYNKLYKVIDLQGTVKIMCGREIYNNSSQGFLNISKETFYKYILPYNEVNIDNIPQNNQRNKLVSKLLQFNGIKIIPLED